MELHQDLADHADARLGALALQGKRVEIVHDLLDRLLEAAARHTRFELRLARRHPMIEQVRRALRLNLVGARAVEALHQQIAVAQRVNGLEQHLRRHLEAGVHLAEILERQRDDRHMPQPHRLERLADERDVVGRAAAAACLGDEHGQLVGIVASAHDGFHDLAGHENRRVADVVVDVFQARIDRAVIHRRQKLHVVAETLEDGHQELE